MIAESLLTLPRNIKHEHTLRFDLVIFEVDEAENFSVLHHTIQRKYFFSQ